MHSHRTKKEKKKVMKTGKECVVPSVTKIKKKEIYTKWHRT